MRYIQPKLKSEILADPYYKLCARFSDGGCRGRVTWEHCWIYGGKQINEKWAIIPLCWRHHLGDLLDKNKNRWLSIRRATLTDLQKYPRMAWEQIRKRLNKIYGTE